LPASLPADGGGEIVPQAAELEGGLSEQEPERLRERLQRPRHLRQASGQQRAASSAAAVAAAREAREAPRVPAPTPPAAGLGAAALGPGTGEDAAAEAPTPALTPAVLPPAAPRGAMSALPVAAQPPAEVAAAGRPAAAAAPGACDELVPEPPAARVPAGSPVAAEGPMAPGAEVEASESHKGLLSWSLEPHMHPLVTESEVAFVVTCLEVLGERCLRAGCARSVALLGEPSSQLPLSPRDALCTALQGVLQERMRIGADTVFVEPRYLLSLGSKKIVKLRMGFAGEETAMSICWDWGVKMEPKAQL